MIILPVRNVMLYIQPVYLKSAKRGSKFRN